MLGSGFYLFFLGIGFYIVEDYQEIFRYVKQRYIEVILEIDMLGYSYVVIMVMKVRYYKYKKAGDIEKVKEFLLCSVDDFLYV